MPRGRLRERCCRTAIRVTRPTELRGRLLAQVFGPIRLVIRRRGDGDETGSASGQACKDGTAFPAGVEVRRLETAKEFISWWRSLLRMGRHEFSLCVSSFWSSVSSPYCSWYGDSHGDSMVADSLSAARIPASPVHVIVAVAAGVMLVVELTDQPRFRAHDSDPGREPVGCKDGPADRGAGSLGRAWWMHEHPVSWTWTSSRSAKSEGGK